MQPKFPSPVLIDPVCPTLPKNAGIRQSPLASSAPNPAARGGLIFISGSGSILVSATAIIHINGTAYITALDVGRALGYEEPHYVRDHLNELDEDEKLTVKGRKLRQLRYVSGDSTPTSIGSKAPSIILVTQSGAEALAMATRTDRAREFRRWISKVVLPAYRAQVAAQSSAPAPSRPPTLAEQREARLMQKEIEAGVRAERMLQKAIAMADRQSRLMEREEQKAARSDARLARAMERMERKTARLAIAMEQEKREAAKLILANSDQLAAAPGILPETIASLRIWAIKQLFGLSLPALLPEAHPEIVWDSALDIARRLEVSLKRVSKIIKELGIRNEPDMFCITLAKAPRSEKIVEVYHYSPTAVVRIEAAIREWLATSPSR